MELADDETSGLQIVHRFIISIEFVSEETTTTLEPDSETDIPEPVLGFRDSDETTTVVAPKKEEKSKGKDHIFWWEPVKWLWEETRVLNVVCSKSRHRILNGHFLH